MPRYLLNPRHQPSEGGVVQAKSHRLSEAGKAAIFSVMLLTLALAAGLLIQALDPPQMLAYIIWGSTPLVAVLILMFLITDEGWTREDRVLLGLHRLGARIWWIAILGTFLISLLATATWQQLSALAITGLVHAAWHLPLVLLTSLYHSDGNLADHSAAIRRYDRRRRIRLRRPSDRHRKHLASLDRARRTQRLVGCTGSTHGL
jgi:hypothetical protein